jgi:CRISPR-associated protein Cmr4
MTAETATRYLIQRYLFMTLDPLHAGAGGYRLGRVDNSIVREPGTRLPKIPGASLHGAARSYAAYLYETPEAAGQNQDKIDNPAQNPVCYTFGYLKKGKDGNEQNAYSGVVNIFDAHILLFPVHSLAGPVWVSTPQRLRDAGFTATPDFVPDEQISLTWEHPGRLNLGWLMLDVAGQTSVQPPTEWSGDPRWNAVQNRIVLVSDRIFSHIVNSNLEVRTSVSIDPHTGAAAEGALFTYEALPRATFLTAEVVLDDYRQAFPAEKCAQGRTDKNHSLPGGEWKAPLDVVKAGLGMMAFLGVGGMGTRGFGRMKIIGAPLEIDPLKDEKQEAAQ